tara:strand:+ start:160 stop:339 length:180 start_codon:yes stop_codon:yes gene_type:complete
MLSRKTFNKYKKLLKIKGEFPYNNDNVKILLYKFYKYEKEFGEANYEHPFDRRIDKENY